MMQVRDFVKQSYRYNPPDGEPVIITTPDQVFKMLSGDELIGFYGFGEKSHDEYFVAYSEVDLSKDTFYKLVETRDIRS